MNDEFEGAITRNSGMNCNAIFPIYTVYSPNGDEAEDKFEFNLFIYLIL
jgi:hypothetical protein